MIKIPGQHFFQRPERKSSKEERKKARALELARKNPRNQKKNSRRQT
jgi:hypothetical protein